VRTSKTDSRAVSHRCELSNRAKLVYLGTRNPLSVLLLSNTGSCSEVHQRICCIFKETNDQKSHVSERHKANDRKLTKCIPIALHYSFHGSTAPSEPRSPNCWGFENTLKTPHSVGLLWTMIGLSEKPLPDNKQHSQETDVHAPCGIRTHNSRKRPAAEPHLAFLLWLWTINSLCFFIY